MLIRGFDALTRNTSQYETWAAGLIEIQSRRLDRQDKFYRDSLKQTEGFQQQAIRLLNLFLDRLPPVKPEIM